MKIGAGPQAASVSLRRRTYVKMWIDRMQRESEREREGGDAVLKNMAG